MLEVKKRNKVFNVLIFSFLLFSHRLLFASGRTVIFRGRL